MANKLDLNGSAGIRHMGIFHDDVLRRSNWAWAGASSVVTVALMVIGYLLSTGWMDTPAKTSDLTKIEHSVTGVKIRLDSLENLSVENARNLAVVIEGQKRADIAQERVFGQIAIITTALIASPPAARKEAKVQQRQKPRVKEAGASWTTSVTRNAPHTQN